MNGAYQKVNVDFAVNTTSANTLNLKYNPGISHYRHEPWPKRLYLPPELDIVEVYCDYKLFAVEGSRKTLSYVTYWRQVKAMDISIAKLGKSNAQEAAATSQSKEVTNKKASNKDRFFREMRYMWEIRYTWGRKENISWEV